MNLCYSTQPDDPELDSTYHLDLDSSFKRILDEKRQVTNKENNPPPATASTSSNENASPSVTAPEKPIRKDLLKERLLSRIHDESSFLDNSYTGENSFTADPEYSMINRLMADFNLNRDSVIGQKRTPLKSLKIPEATALPQSPIKKNASPYKSNMNVRNMSVNYIADSSRSEAPADDTLEEMEYVLDRGLNYVPKRLREQMEKQRQQETRSDDSVSTLKNAGESNKQLPNIELNEYDEENDENNSKTIENNGTTADGNNDDDDDDVILIESSPENSFATTTGHFKSALESVDNTFYTAKSILHRRSTSSTMSNTLTNLSADDSQADTSDVIILDDDISKNDARDSGINQSASPSSIDEDDNASSLSDPMPNFNDTLERVEYFMAQAEKLQKAATPAKSAATPNVKVSKPTTPMPKSVKTATPKSAKMVMPTVKVTKPYTPNTKHLTPDIGGKRLLPTSSNKPMIKALTPGKTDVFKRPGCSPGFQSKSASKVLEARPQSRIPTKQKLQFRHIASPIAAYIRNTPEVPLIKTVTSAKRIQQNNAFFAATSTHGPLDESVQSVESYASKTPLPCKMYMSASQRQVTNKK